MNQLDNVYDSIVQELENRIHNHELQGSRFRFESILSSKLNIFRNYSFGGGTYVKSPFPCNNILNINNSTSIH